MSTDTRRLQDLLAHRPLQVDLELTIEHRVHAYAQRLNARLAQTGDSDPYDTRDDRDLAQVIMLLCETALDSDEHATEHPDPPASS
jgi:hypothetical protein